MPAPDAPEHHRGHTLVEDRAQLFDAVTARPNSSSSPRRRGRSLARPSTIESTTSEPSDLVSTTIGRAPLSKAMTASRSSMRTLRSRSIGRTTSTTSMFAASTWTSPGVAPGRRNSVVRGDTGDDVAVAHAHPVTRDGTQVQGRRVLTRRRPAPRPSSSHQITSAVVPCTMLTRPGFASGENSTSDESPQSQGAQHPDDVLAQGRVRRR